MATKSTKKVAPVQEAAGSGAEKTEESQEDVEPRAEITYDDFARLQFQVGEIIACEEVKKSKKLLCSQVKIGNQVRQIVSGIKAWYTPEQMVGKKVMVLVNLAPRKMAGVMSEGMLLCAEDSGQSGAYDTGKRHAIRSRDLLTENRICLLKKSPGAGLFF